MTRHKNPYQNSTLDVVFKDLSHQVKEHRIRPSASQILALLISIAFCLIMLSKLFDLSFPEAVLVSALIAGASGVIFGLIRKLK